MRCVPLVPTALLGLLGGVASAACDAPAPVAPGDDAGAPMDRRARLALIRDSAAEMGVHNATLFAGIAISETQLAHCWSEARYACKGPDSPSCGGPIIAGSADGPCAAMQGGLGMFQFDAGTWTETLATYGDAILTVEGNAAQAVSFVVHHVMADLAVAAGWLAATGWLDGVPLAAGDPKLAHWARLMACRYNGCCADSALCRSRADGYRDHALEAYQEMGAAFWQTADRCTELPAGGVIAPRSACYVAAGDPRAWHREAAGYTGARERAATGAPASFARWIVRVPAAGRYRVEAYAESGSATASYRVAHAGAVETVAVDQAAATGFVALGELAFAGAGDEYVELTADGAPGGELVFDAIRLAPVAMSPIVEAIAGPGSGPGTGRSMSDGRGMIGP